MLESKKTVLHVIDTLGRGGAETLLVGYVRELKDYNHILVYLSENNEFENELQDVNVIKLGFSRKTTLLLYSLKLYNIIKMYKVDLIHSHLYWSTIIARLSNLKKIPHFFSIHNKINETVFTKHPYTKVLEKLTYSKSQTGLAVSNAVKEDYIHSIKPAGDIKVLYNYIEDKFFEQASSLPVKPKSNAKLKLVSVGNLKHQKNYPFLIKAFSKLNNQSVCLDIYGAGPMYNELMDLINKYQLSETVRLQGSVPHLEEVLPTYDAFVMASTVEGFGLAPIEAMAMGLPLLLSNINVLQEVASSHAFYFDAYNSDEFVTLIHSIIKQEVDLYSHVHEGRKYAHGFAKRKYLEELSNLYCNALKGVS
ncbi:glycosyltransferase [Rufibacter roseolus]|uniref:glycosyltransferase n=1 Tax=Rufibacter roseolus TaxID=2817375 RepID=UPI001B30792D|nr:glycosyltransferase [Rufibacter roseolus]